MTADHGAIDCWVNVTMGDSVPPEFLKRVKEDYFKGGDEFFASLTPEDTIEAMDEAGVAKAVLVVEVGRPSEKILEFVERHPDRFFLAAMVDPTKGMRPLWALQEMVAEFPVIMAKAVPFGIDVAPSDAIYYPLYAKCIELDLPLTINTGLPGPPMPGECQHPIHLDRVCYRFPQLRLVMAHGADPWWDVAIRLMIKYANLSLMTSAYSPKYFPDELIHFMNTRGQDKIMFSSDHPVLSMQRCIGEAEQLDLREGVLDKFLRANAEQVFFTPRDPHPRKSYLR
ncbi:MAG: amidohydrolase family protein [Acidimicrobiia bacterium]|nr:amidohydrolase family protein [Acidimicrobiia bacterium]